ncbi:spore coat U domain-containing protein [Serratia sp. AKBS12]|uniref:Csu type fimbrial protein n=1 Tax=Serratia sp. AKBS12 TaxID=2974597 RepID=UPI0021656E52|nr:spore coat U domain-containing protein [Serratia sp. AKBS12]MCS3408955.1 spore coat U domain-containing protein [Serratia sp. AKBS12]
MRRAAVAAAMLAFSLGASADSKSASIGVSATLVNACEAGSNAGSNVNFGSLDFGTVSFLHRALTTTGQQNAGAIRVKCNSGTGYAVLLGGGQSGTPTARYLQNAAGQRVNYGLYTSASYSVVWDDQTGVTQVANGQDQWLAVYGRIPAQATPATGIYTDTVQVTINW